MAIASTDGQLSGFTKLLMQEGGLSESEIQIHIKEARQNKVNLITQLVQNKLVNSRAVAMKASVEFGLPFFDLDAIDWRSLPISLVSEN